MQTTAGGFKKSENGADVINERSLQILHINLSACCVASSPRPRPYFWEGNKRNAFTSISPYAKFCIHYQSPIFVGNERCIRKEGRKEGRKERQLGITCGKKNMATLFRYRLFHLSHLCLHRWHICSQISVCQAGDEPSQARAKPSFFQA